MPDMHSCIALDKIFHHVPFFHNRGMFSLFHSFYLHQNLSFLLLLCEIFIDSVQWESSKRDANLLPASLASTIDLYFVFRVLNTVIEGISEDSFSITVLAVAVRTFYHIFADIGLARNLAPNE